MYRGNQLQNWVLATCHCCLEGRRGIVMQLAICVIPSPFLLLYSKAFTCIIIPSNIIWI